jgi:hypothetical protein
MRRRIVLIWFVLVSGVGNAQISIIECPVNAKALFEVVIDIFQSYDSLGKVKLQASLAGATPHFA